ncbi:MAG: nucleotidyltransferase family protein [Cetobacterium sp.]
MKFGLTERELDEIKIIYHLFPEIEKIIIFGSRARGDFRRTSDIDIALIGNVEKIIYKIRDYFDESRIIYTVDVVDFSKIESSAFKEDIEKEGIEL